METTKPGAIRPGFVLLAAYSAVARRVRNRMDATRL
jgi:hypothetical protein